MSDFQLDDVSFGQPVFFAVAVAIPLALLLLAGGALSRRRAARRFGVTLPPRGAAAVAGALTLAVAIALIAVAAARPQWGEEETSFDRQGIDVVVALDTSLSMLSRDVEPGRLELAKAEVDKLLESLRGDRVGLVTFAGEAILRFPLTTDIRVAQQITRTTNVDTTLGSGSNPAAAINMARSAFVEDGSTTKVLILITDGEELGGTGERSDTALEARRAAEDGVRVIVVGVGTTAGGQIPIRSQASGETTFKIDSATGKPAITRLNEASLQSLAKAVEGQYIPLNTSSGLGSIAERLAQLKTSAFFQASEPRPIERFQMFAVAAVALLALQPALAILLRPTAARRRAAFAVTAALTLTVLFVACGEDATFGLNRDGNERFNQKDYAGALEKYRDAQKKRPDLAALNYNAANALYRNGEVDRAVEEAQRALNTDDADVLARAYYSLGNFYAGLDRWLEARAAYRNALIQQPSEIDTKYNLEVANRKSQGPAPSPTPTPSPEPPGGPNASPTPGPGASPTPGDGTPTPGGSATPSPGGSPTPGAGQPGQPQGSAGQTSAEDPTQITSAESKAIEDALAKLDSGNPYEVEEALRILDMLRRAQSGSSSGLPQVPVEGRQDW